MQLIKSKPGYFSYRKVRHIILAISLLEIEISKFLQ